MAEVENRNARRSRVLKAAKLVSMNDWTYVDGVVRDNSATGARISCENPVAIPQDFRLLVLQDSTIQDCTVVWRRNKLMGVAFTSDAKRAPPRKI